MNKVLFRETSVITVSTSGGVSNFRIKSNTVFNNDGYGMITNGACSDGQVWNNIDGGGNVKGFKSLSETNINYES